MFLWWNICQFLFFFIHQYLIPGHDEPPEVAIVPEGPEIIAEGTVGPVIATLPADGPATTIGSTREG